MKRIILPLLICAMLSALPLRDSLGQDADEYPTIAFGFWQCKSSALDSLVEYERERWLPLAQELVDEGQIQAYGHLRHAWGDEWNFVEWVTAGTREPALDADGELRRRFQDRYPDDSLFMETCTAHHDNVYTLRLSTGTPAAVDPANAPAFSLSFWKCPFNEVQRIIGREDSLTMPIARELVNEGQLRSMGWLIHQWGDEWNLARYASAADIPALIAAYDEIDVRMDQRHPEPPPAASETCSAHKDNLYFLVHRTRPQTAN